VRDRHDRAEKRDFSLVADFERRGIFRLHFTPIANPGGGDVRVAEPLLDLRNIGIVIKRIGGGGSAQRVSANL
jgi:hypothetical protein